MTRPALLFSALLSVTVVTAACSEDGATRRPRTGKPARVQTDPETGEVLPDYNDPRTKEKEGFPDPLERMAHGTAQNDALCARAGVMDETNPNFNAVTNAFCKDKKTVTNMRELQAALGLAFQNRNANGTNASNGNPGFSFLSHSSSLVARGVSSINPRAFLFSPPPGQPVRIPGFVVMTFVRGEEFVEIAAESPKAGNKLTFYLLKFEKTCGKSCTNAELLSPEVEKGWTEVSIYDDEDLKNNLLDCRHCHQPEGPGTPVMLRMQELEDPWTHWFRSDRPGGLTLMKDYFRAHGTDEEYMGIPGVLIPKSDGLALEDLVVGQGFGKDKQPNLFDTKAIEQEIKESSELQPEINIPVGNSPTWQRNYNAAFEGRFIPPPYHDVKVTDPDKLQIATDSYKAFMSGQATDMLDTRRVFLNEALEAMTIEPKSGASGKEVLIQTCAQCHHPKLDQSISRAKFDVTRMDSMTRDEKNLAIQRMKLGSANRLHMPPTNMRYLPDDARDAAIKYLEQ
ncbi:MAG: hypothetical protein KIT84_27945 [Labilithrix sp.]|nr:hypothetical protein [Labilithrix sp.]MCW5814891.1 hypothetical protein [Labilithrix sp.]